MSTNNLIKISALTVATDMQPNDYVPSVRIGLSGATNSNLRIPTTQFVWSFKGRSGTVLPQQGDYTTSQISESTNALWFLPAERNKLGGIQANAVAAGQAGDTHAALPGNPHGMYASQVLEGTLGKVFTSAERIKVGFSPTGYGTSGELFAGTSTTIKAWTPKILKSSIVSIAGSVTSGGGSTGGTVVYILSKVTGPALPNSIPVTGGNSSAYGLVPQGGGLGKILKKNTTGDYGYVWGDDLTGSGGGGYSAVQVNGSSVTGRSILNFSSLFTVSDNVSSTRTDINLVKKLRGIGGLASGTPGIIVGWGATGAARRTLTVSGGGILLTNGSATGGNPKFVVDWGTTASNKVPRGTHSHTRTTLNGLLDKVKSINVSWSGKPAASGTRNIINNTTGNIYFPTGLNLRTGAETTASGTATFDVRTSSNNGSSFTSKGTLRFLSGARTASIHSGFTTGLLWPVGYILSFKAPTTQNATLKGPVISFRGNQD